MSCKPLNVSKISRDENLEKRKNEAASNYVTLIPDTTAESLSDEAYKPAKYRTSKSMLCIHVWKFFSSLRIQQSCVCLWYKRSSFRERWLENLWCHFNLILNGDFCKSNYTSARIQNKIVGKPFCRGFFQKFRKSFTFKFTFNLLILFFKVLHCFMCVSKLFLKRVIPISLFEISDRS